MAKEEAVVVIEVEEKAEDEDGPTGNTRKEKPLKIMTKKRRTSLRSNVGDVTSTVTM